MVISNEVLQESARRLLLRASDSSFLRTRLSGIDVWLPAETILTMTHCLRIGETGDILLDIETPQLEWMSARLRPGSHFIDVGAATGAICLPLAIRFGAGVKITAFEPAPPARRLL